MSASASGRVDTIEPIRRDEAGRVVMLDQRLLPAEETYRSYEDADEVAEAIRAMVIRGAPAIGVAAAMGLAAGARRLPAEGFAEAFAAMAERMRGARPTAINLAWATRRMERLARGHDGSHAALLEALDAEAERIRAEDVASNRTLGRLGQELVADGARVLTHCNTGSLATAGYGTALGVVRAALEAGKRVSVWIDETRPFLQGGRLTTWECLADGIDGTLIADGAAGHLMAQGRVDAVITGSDRIAANGDVANKIGTYTLAVLAARHGVPFYVAAPTSTVDADTPSGEAIPIEERAADEVRTALGHPIAPEGYPAANPAFDVTPAELVHAIVTERGVARPPSEATVRPLVADARDAA